VSISQLEQSKTEQSADITIEVSVLHNGSRFDHFLVQHVSGSSRSLLNQAIRRGLIRVNGAEKKSSYKLKTGEKITGSLYVPAAPTLKPQNISFPVLYEDSDLLIISKPPGLVVHPAHGNPDGTLVNGLLYYCQEIAGIGDEVRPGIVHRLDKDTSGIMVVAKTVQSHRILSDEFKARTVDKEYLALVRGILKEKTGRIVANIDRHPINRKKMAVCEEGRGRYAVSNWQVLEEYAGPWSLIRVKIETGRTHQIRVHMTSLGHPVAGDKLYGRGRDAMQFSRQMLHAHRLQLPHPVTGEIVSFTAPLWDDFRQKRDKLRLAEYTVVSSS
jgi:23S rRNA pseudouridine1911/1915/1917 synthase